MLVLAVDAFASLVPPCQVYCCDNLDYAYRAVVAFHVVAVDHIEVDSCKENRICFSKYFGNCISFDRNNTSAYVAVAFHNYCTVVVAVVASTIVPWHLAVAADIDSVVLDDFVVDMGPIADADYRMVAVTSAADADHAWDIDYSSHLDYGHYDPSSVNLADRLHRGPYRLHLVSMSLPRDCAGTRKSSSKYYFRLVWEIVLLFYYTWRCGFFGGVSKPPWWWWCRPLCLPFKWRSRNGWPLCRCGGGTVTVMLSSKSESSWLSIRGDSVFSLAFGVLCEIVASSVLCDVSSCVSSGALGVITSAVVAWLTDGSGSGWDAGGSTSSCVTFFCWLWTVELIEIIRK